MKKIFFIVFLMALSGLFTSNSYGSALDDLNNAARDGEAATREPSNEGARDGSGQGFDTSAPTPVDLTGKDGVVDPSDLKQYDPQK